jgi:Na+-driven multidrug efflux pump
MKNYALGLLILTNLVIYLTNDLSVDSGYLSFLLTLVMVVLVAFVSSSLLRNVKNLKMTRNYLYSGIIGVVFGLIFIFWVNSNIQALQRWFEEYGLALLLIINLICALTIFFARKRKNIPETSAA